MHPSNDEPDRVEFSASGFRCIVLRDLAYGGHLCGYVAVPPEHPLHGADAERVTDMLFPWEVDYARPCDPVRGVCHVPEPGEPDDVWWFGFACDHDDDVIPARAGEASPGATYKTVAVVREATERLAAWLLEQT